jgi:hypothetical protein
LSLVNHLSYFLETAFMTFSTDDRYLLAGVLHLSSVAIMDHTRPHSMIDETAPLPDTETYNNPYDWTKRKTEDALAAACESLDIRCVHLRISAIFSTNTSLNMCQAMRLILERMDDNAINVAAAATTELSTPRNLCDNLLHDEATLSTVDTSSKASLSEDWFLETPAVAAAADSEDFGCAIRHELHPPDHCPAAVRGQSGGLPGRPQHLGLRNPPRVDCRGGWVGDY